MATYVQIDPTQKLEPFKAVKKIPLEEYFTSGHRTCQGCESALVMKMMAKAAGPVPENTGLAGLGKLGYSGSLSLGSFVPDVMAHGGGAPVLAATTGAPRVPPSRSLVL